jgi:hypothetical protein
VSNPISIAAKGATLTHFGTSCASSSTVLPGATKIAPSPGAPMKA